VKKFYLSALSSLFLVCLLANQSFACSLSSQKADAKPVKEIEKTGIGKRFLPILPVL
jgi:hypothetical protein